MKKFINVKTSDSKGKRIVKTLAEINQSDFSNKRSFLTLVQIRRSSYAMQHGSKVYISSRPCKSWTGN
jgi:hypothetical protein